MNKKFIAEFNGKVGNIFIEKAEDGSDHPYEVWFEDFCILGDGDSELEALNNAWSHTADMMTLISAACVKVAASTIKTRQPTGTNDVS